MVFILETTLFVMPQLKAAQLAAKGELRETVSGIKYYKLEEE